MIDSVFSLMQKSVENQISEVVLTVVMGILDFMYRSMSKMRVVVQGRSTVERSNDLTLDSRETNASGY